MRFCLKFGSLVGFALLSSGIFADFAGAADPSLAKILIGPPNDQQLSDMLNNPNDWATLRTEVGGIIHADHTLTSVDDTTLRGWFARMSAQNLRLELEVGAIKRWSAVGAKTFKIESAIWDRLIRLGAPLSSIAMDEPLIAARNEIHQSDRYAVDQTAQFVALVRQRYPKLLIGDIEPYPAVSSSDQTRWIDALDVRIKALGARGLDFYRVDPDWAAFPARGSWLGVKLISDQCTKRGLAFSLIYWAANAPAKKAQGTLTDQTWENGLVHEAQQFRAVGGTSNQIVVESWIGLPSKALPETSESTFTGSIGPVVKISQSAR